MPILKLLLVDDDQGFRRSLAIALELKGHRVVEMENGMEAIDFLKSDQKQADRVENMIIDARMPGLDGFWVADHVSAAYPHLKVVILSAFAYPERYEDYTILQKPVRISDLLHVLTKDEKNSGTARKYRDKGTENLKEITEKR